MEKKLINKPMSLLEWFGSDPDPLNFMRPVSTPVEDWLEEVLYYVQQKSGFEYSLSLLENTELLLLSIAFVLNRYELEHDHFIKSSKNFQDVNNYYYYGNFYIGRMNTSSEPLVEYLMKEYFDETTKVLNHSIISAVGILI